MSKMDSLNQTVFRRPSQGNLEDGVYDGEIVGARVMEVDSKYHPEGRTVLNLKTQLHGEEDTVEIFKSVTFSWSPKGKMIPLLADLEMLPAPGEELDIDNLIGIPVKAIVQNVDRDGNTYSNILTLKRRRVRRAAAPVQPKVVEEDFDDIFDEE